MSERFNGSAVIVWMQDSRQKFKMFEDEKEFDKALERLKETVPDRCIFCLAVNWDSKEVMTFIGDAPEEQKN